MNQDYYAGKTQGRIEERERIIKLLEDADSICSYWAIELVKKGQE